MKRPGDCTRRRGSGGRWGLGPQESTLNSSSWTSGVKDQVHRTRRWSRAAWMETCWGGGPMSEEWGGEQYGERAE